MISSGQRSELDYHARAEVSRSDLAMFRESRRNFLAVKEGRMPGIGDDQFTDELDIGTAAHLLTLEPERFVKEVAVWDGKVRGGKVWDKFQKRCEAEGKIILREKDWWLVAVAGAVVQNRLQKIVGHPHAFREKSIFWSKPVTIDEDQTMALDLRCRLDLGILIPQKELWIFDIKTTTDCASDKFRSEMKRRAYWLQDAHYTAAGMEEFGIPFENTRFVFIPIGKKICERIAKSIADNSCEYGPDQLAKCRESVKGIEQLACDMVELTFEQREKAMQKWESLLVEYANCVKTGEWGDPGEDDVKLVDNVVS